ncbi:MAG: ribonuclease J, partial [Thermomicrobiales bacterium]
MFLGGIGEVGKNLFLLETDQDIVVGDCGLGFPEEDEFGIDIVLPDITYLRERKEKLRGIFITHGHEDHIGGIAHLWPELEAPIHATKLTAGLIEGKLREAKLLGTVPIHVFDADEHPKLEAGDFTIEPFRVCHSIPDAVGFGITTPAGLIVHTSDFKFDPTPIDGRQSDFALLEQFGDRGVRLLISDCVHVESPGWTKSERVVGETYEDIFAQAPGRIIIATFASLIARVQQVIDVAGRHGRKVATLGRSLEGNVRIATELGYLNDHEGVLVPAKAARSMDPHDLVYVVTGSQGEPMAVLNRISNGDHRDIEIGVGDTVIVSATPIPGNETSVFKIIDRLFGLGAEVIYSARALVHVSGHASQDELVRMIDLTRPEHVVPTHGEARHLALYTELAIGAGIAPGNIHHVGLGDVVVIDGNGVRIDDEEGPIEVGHVYVEGGIAGEVTDEILDERKVLAREGVVAVTIVIDELNGDLLDG